MEYYLPVITSPKASPQKNLTGNPRVVKDLAADVHADIQKWNGTLLDGVNVLKSIALMKVDESYSEELQELCDKLESHVNKMDEVVSSLKQTVIQIKAVASLQQGKEKLFVTWPTKKFVKTIEKIHEAYDNEAKVKRKVLENAAHGHTKSWHTLQLSTWVQQPKIPDYINILLEALLTETGHR